jgi:hypothetical protein
MIIEAENTVINKRAQQNNIHIQSIKEYKQIPQENTNIQITVDNMNIRVNNGTIKKVAYLFLYLGLNVQSISTIDESLKPEQGKALIKAIQNKIANQAIVGQLQKEEKKSQPDTIEPISIDNMFDKLAEQTTA